MIYSEYIFLVAYVCGLQEGVLECDQVECEIDYPPEPQHRFFWRDTETEECNESDYDDWDEFDIIKHILYPNGRDVDSDNGYTRFLHKSYMYIFRNG